MMVVVRFSADSHSQKLIVKYMYSDAERLGRFSMSALSYGRLRGFGGASVHKLQYENMCFGTLKPLQVDDIIIL